MVLFKESPSTGDRFTWLDSTSDKKSIVITEKDLDETA